MNKIRGLILTGSKEQYLYCLKINKLNRKEFIYLDDMELLKKYSNVPIIKYGTYYYSKLIKELSDKEIIDNDA